MAEEPQVGFVTMGDAAAGEEIPSIGIGMLGYAFMGKALERAEEDRVHDVAAAVHPAARRDLGAKRGGGQGGRPYGYEKWSTDWRRRREPGRPGVRQRRAERRPPRADGRGGEGGQAHHLREAARTAADGGYEIWKASPTV